MIRTSPATIRRAAATVVAAAVFSFTTHHASAQNIDLFAGSAGTTPALSVGGTVSAPGTASGAFGPGFMGTLTFTAGALNVLSEGFAPSGVSNTFTISETGTLPLTLAGSTTAIKTYTGTTLTPGGTYALTLTDTNSSTVTLLNNVNVTLAEGTTNVLSTSQGIGLGGIVNLVNLFGSGNTASLLFTVPAGAQGDLSLTITSTELAGVAGGSFTFASASIAQVPEPPSVAAMLLGATGLVALRFRRRLRAA